MQPFLRHLPNYATGSWKPGTGHLFFLFDPANKVVLRTASQEQANQWAEKYGVSIAIGDQDWQNALNATVTGVPTGYEKWLFRDPKYAADVIASLSTVPEFKERLDVAAKAGGAVEEAQRILGLVK